MTDYYSQRLQRNEQAHKERFSSPSLPMQRPTSNEQVSTDPNTVRVMAEKPTGTESAPETDFMRDLTRYSQEDPNFQTVMDAMQVKAEALKKQYAGMNLPPEILERQVREMVLSEFGRQRGIRSQQPPINSSGALPTETQIPMESSPPIPSAPLMM